MLYIKISILEEFVEGRIVGRKIYKVCVIGFCMADSTMAMPAGFGGLTRYNEEYDSKFKFGPGAVVGMIVVTIVLVVGLRIFYA